MYRSPALSVLDPLRLEELKATGRLPSPQGVALRIVELTRRNDADLNGIAAVARTDPALTARILKAANAPAMGLTRPLVTVRDALLLLGLPAARKLVLGFSLVPAHRQGVCAEFDYVRYWRQSIVTGLAAQGIAARLQTMAPEEAFVCGLLCGIGRLALATLYPEEYSDLLRVAATGSDDELRLAERRAFETDHLELAAVLLQDWGMPFAHTQAVREHADPEGAKLPDGSRPAMLARVLNLATASQTVRLWDGRATRTRPGRL